MLRDRRLRGLRLCYRFARTPIPSRERPIPVSAKTQVSNYL